RALQDGTLRLLLTSPEKLLTAGSLAALSRLPIGSIAIDEAHCISQWGHDFRPEYRQLAQLRAHFPGVPINAYTATATPRVRDDIVAQLSLTEPRIIVGTFDRPNLTYRVLPRVDGVRQTVEAVARHPSAASIVYCISRADTEALAAGLRAKHINARAYHAGLDATTRNRVSEDFRDERLNVVVATVAFGMGIDRSDVRLVVHAAMPKSIEGYQQETGRAGRDGLPAECLLLYSAADAIRWRQIIDRAAAENATDAAHVAHQHAVIDQMQRLVNAPRCRHRALSEYFGQPYPADDCAACDCCLKELEAVTGSHEIAQKILSCVARCGQSFGAKHITDVLLGLANQRIREKGHERLSTFGLLAGTDRRLLGSFIDQLIDAGLLARATGEYPVLQLTPSSAAILKSERRATLMKPKADLGTSHRERRAPSAASPDADADAPPLSRSERDLFEALRLLRRETAQRLGVPPYVVFTDVTLEELARARPSTLDAMADIRGIGQRKLQDFGASFLQALVAFCSDNALGLDAAPGSRPRRATGDAPSPLQAPRNADVKRIAFDLFSRGVPVEDVVTACARSRSTVIDYLTEFVIATRPESVERWLSPGNYARITAALDSATSARLKPVFDALGGAVPFDEIRVVKAHRSAVTT
ncbi:MAG: RecQ family ATP-dependent DNA helicase, partial [Phycisphaerales bacterium]